MDEATERGAAAPDEERHALEPVAAERARMTAVLERERQRTEAVRIVLNAVLASVPPKAINRRQFQAIVAQAGRETPDSGPEAARHTVLLTEARRVLGIEVNLPL